MEVFAILLSLSLLLMVAYRGWSVIFWAPLLALLAAVLSDLPVLPAYTELYMAKAAGYFKSFFPIFLLGAVFGKVMEVSGMAASIAKKIFSTLGPNNAVLSTVLAASILTYGGVSMFVVVFAVYPFASALFKEAKLPKRLLPASIFLGSFTFTMDALPGTPQIQNLIPAQFYGTSLYAAPMLGSVISLCIFGLGLGWLSYRVKMARMLHEGYGDHHVNESQLEHAKLPHWGISLIPLLTVLIVNIVCSKWISGWDDSYLNAIREFNPPLMTAGIKTIFTTWGLIIALVLAISITLCLNAKTLLRSDKATVAINTGAIGSLLAIVNTASEVGYGNVIAALPGFRILSNALISIEGWGGPLLSQCLTVNILSGVTGSASGGLSISLSLFKDRWVELAAINGIPLEVMHRVASIAAGGLDTLPHNGAVITLLAVCGMTHRKSYPDIFVMTLFKVGISLFAVLLWELFGIV